jgi:RES domain-containing protein
MLEAWRILKEKHADTAFSGEGAAKFGGRWNSRGVRIVYVSSSKSLATLESLVHLNPPVLFNYVAIQIRFDEALTEKFPLSKLPADWGDEPPPPSTKRIGDTWVRERRSPILALPSRIISGEPNYLLNPAHPGFTQITFGKPEKFTFDPRLLA